MEYEDRIAIFTPEGIELEYALAGLGSRFIAELIDIALRVVLLGLLLGVLAALGGGAIAEIAFLLASFLALFAYDVLFEVWAAGRTPGKRWSGLRVVMTSGRPIGFASSAVRNVVRLLDGWGTAFVVGAIAILATERNQRLGDLAAGTIVVRERRANAGPGALSSAAAPLRGDESPVDVTAVTALELATIREFLARRETLKPQARERVSQRLAEGLGAKVGGLPPGGLAPERLLEAIAAAKAAPGALAQPPAD